MRKIEVYDTTLRDGAQTEGIAFSVEDKIRITEKLDELGIHYVEGGLAGVESQRSGIFQEGKETQACYSPGCCFRQHPPPQISRRGRCHISFTA